jgi:isoquinoline 1-oxidoreductase
MNDRQMNDNPIGQSVKPPMDTALEPERYELAAPPLYSFEMERRDFFKTLGGGLLIVLAAGEAHGQQDSGGAQRRNQGRSMPQEIGAWLHIGEDGVVTVFTGKVEVGQDIRTSLTQAVAEELRLPVAQIRMAMGDTDLTPYDAGTFGSMTTRVMHPQLRRAAAAAREMLIDLAAERLEAGRDSLVIADEKVAHTKSGRQFGYGQLTKGRKLMKAIGDAAPLTPPEQWKVAGRRATKVNGDAIVTGRHKFTTDIKLPGMHAGKVLRPPAVGATIGSIDTSEAEKMSGVKVVRDGDFTGVVAPGEHAASQALATIRAEWKTTPQPSGSELYDYLKKNPVESQGFGGRSGNNRGSIAEGMAAAHHKLQQTYTVAYIAHAPLEPRAAVAEWKDGRLTVWTGTQRPFGVRSELAGAFRIPEDQVRVIVPDTGSGYGGKHTGEAAIEAARLAKAAGKPVKLVWTREEEFNWAYFRPAGVIEVTSGASRDGAITAWEFHNYNSGSAAIGTLYDIPNQRIEFHPARSPLRQGSYRALAATANHFARETHMDELAQSLKLDPLEFRLKNLKDQRLRAVLEAAAKAFGWGKSRPGKDRGFGIAGGFEKGGYVANCLEVAVDHASGKVRIARIVTAFECGPIVNPDGLKNQVEGSIIQGLGGALFEAIEFENGKILNPRFSRYRVPRFSDVPPLETVLLDRKDLPPAGAGEAPIITVAPAIGNAIFDASGIRLRSLPLIPRGLKA